MFGWVLQASDGHSGRVNAAWPLQLDDEIPFDAQIDEIEGWYRAKGRPAWFRVVEQAAPELCQALAARGYAPDTPTLVMTGAVGGRSADPDVSIERDPSDDFFAPMREATPDAGEYAERRDVVSRTPRPRGFGMLRLDGRPAAVGASVVTGSLALIFIMRTAPWAQRRGLARRVLRTLLTFAEAHGAESAYLQVEAANAAAIALYESEGFVTAYRYTYWRPRA